MTVFNLFCCCSPWDRVVYYLFKTSVILFCYSVVVYLFLVCTVIFITWSIIIIVGKVFFLLFVFGAQWFLSLEVRFFLFLFLFQYLPFGIAAYFRLFFFNYHYWFTLHFSFFLIIYQNVLLSFVCRHLTLQMMSYLIITIRGGTTQVDDIKHLNRIIIVST